MNSPGTDIPAATLREALHSWGETLETLRITLTEDRPAPGLSALADGLADATDEAIGWLQEADARLAAPGAGAAREMPRLVARALRIQGDRLFGSSHQAQLERLARSGGGPWHAWVTAIRQASEPLWARAEDAVKHLAASGGPPPEPFAHTTYLTTNIRNTDTLNPST
jgi:hypothetical protein